MSRRAEKGFHDVGARDEIAAIQLLARRMDPIRVKVVRLCEKQAVLDSGLPSRQIGCGIRYTCPNDGDHLILFQEGLQIIEGSVHALVRSKTGLFAEGVGREPGRLAHHCIPIDRVARCLQFTGEALLPAAGVVH